MATENENLPVGIELLSATEASLVATVGSDSAYSFGIINLLRPGVDERDADLISAFIPSDLQIADATYAGYLVGGISSCDALESDQECARQRCEALVKQQCAWAAHLGLSAIMFRYPDTDSGVNFARVVTQTLSMLAYTQAWVRLSLSASDGRSWKRWNLLRTLCEHNPKLLVVLELDSQLPEDFILQQWLAEPIRALILPTSIFISNNKGFPVLPKRHQEFMRQAMEQEVQFVVSARSADETRHESGGLAAYRQYIQYLHRTRPEPDVIDKFAAGYHDYLQAPLQPLMDNLESATYEVFEKDPIKYQEYERAIHRALLDRVPAGSSAITVIMVVGAGRGPLVHRALQAAEAANRNVKIYAVEKNPNAVVTLRCRQAAEWGDKVKVVHCDMRFWDAPEHADIIVSELLGSFGDNELSPECLDGAQRFLKEDGISIPSSYTAYISPLSSSKLFHEVSSYKDEAHMETPYVVKFRAVHELAEPKSVWTFIHPDRSVKLQLGSPHFNHHNSRYSKQRFEISQDAMLHGIAGYFEATLYKDVMISIHPKTHSPGMFSWFPIFFPLKTPIYLPASSKVDIHFWRLSDTRKVWYEWSVIPVFQDDQSAETALVGSSSVIHNVGGRSSWIGL